ncbi:DUF3152 domain-containing protein [Streptomyces spiralis]|uniref:DUF3152 domain-containing protein n=1 Tax=Streptomyces spiralis TaxID=66376 RepID=UPI0033CBA3BE
MPGTTLPSSGVPGSTGARGRRTARRAARRRAHRRRRGYVLFAVATACTLGVAALNAGGRGGDGPQAGAAATKGQEPTPSPRRTEGRSTPTQEESGSPETGNVSPKPSGTPKVLQHGNGQFETAQASGKVYGKGTRVRRYMVKVEQGTGIAADEAAREIERILADERGWTADGRDAFQLVSRQPYDFLIDIASPDTTDRICAEGGLDTHGEVNCDVGPRVVVNLKRWLTGSPEFTGPVSEYRALIINHEVGHRIGHGHETCPGPGRPAPAMMQQIYGLKGCKPNAWPYDSEGRYLGGPQVP